MKKITVKNLISSLKKLGFKVFETGEYNLNLVGIRSKDETTNTFNDVLAVFFKNAGEWVLFQFPITTDPGQFYLEHPLSVHGCAIVKPGQYPGLWTLGFHRAQYKALVQTGDVTVFRDNNQDKVLDFENPQTGRFGINLHRAAKAGESQVVHKWSAGCQVMANPFDFDVLMSVCEKSASVWGNSFTYTLINETDL